MLLWGTVASFGFAVLFNCLLFIRGTLERFCENHEGDNLVLVVVRQ